MCMCNEVNTLIFVKQRRDFFNCYFSMAHSILPYKELVMSKQFTLDLMKKLYTLLTNL